MNAGAWLCMCVVCVGCKQKEQKATGELRRHLKLQPRPLSHTKQKQKEERVSQTPCPHTHTDLTQPHPTWGCHTPPPLRRDPKGEPLQQPAPKN